MNEKLQEMHQRNNNALVTRLNWLTERNHQLEQVVKEGCAFFACMHGGDPLIADWLQRAKALVEQEV